MRNRRNTLGDTTGLDFDQLYLVCYAEDTFQVDGDGHEMVGKLEEVAPGVCMVPKMSKWKKTGLIQGSARYLSVIAVTLCIHPGLLKMMF